MNYQENYRNRNKNIGRDIKHFFDPNKHHKKNNNSNSCNYNMNNSELNCYKNNYPDLSSLNYEQLQKHWSTTGCKQNRNNQCPNYQTTSGQYKYVGCFNDKSNRAIQNFRGNVSSVNQCMNIAQKYNENVFGVQYGKQCFTSNDLNKYNIYGQNFNKNNCPQMGASWTNQVYVRGQPLIQTPLNNQLNQPTINTNPQLSQSNFGVQ